VRAVAGDKIEEEDETRIEAGDCARSRNASFSLPWSLLVKRLLHERPLPPTRRPGLQMGLQMGAQMSH
jgi:hypothetical protein